ncbi:glycosyltransferase family 10 domain-containing protein [Pedobacter agri]|uniref:glycosyltransferase family 10 domain-containing protein n=1 Tax=Pedobacter agri TaxID=454586 RepID=UPI00292CE8AB|nr:glycosyltransferase family 10 [Pedobacter agri]
MIKKRIKIKFINGLKLDTFKQDVFDVNGVSEYFDFQQSDQPNFIVFGPYGNNLPPIGNYIRIGYFCENIVPDLSICEWAFGIPRDEEINNPKYKRIQWHGFDPALLIKKITDNDIDRILNQKKKFCNFLYSNLVPHREDFFKQLSKYKKIDAPGKSMNNMPSIDSIYNGDVWERKRKFLSEYKFTIAFENYAYPGYQTEKLYDAMRENSLPIYCGDNYIDEIFNPKSFINTPNYLKVNNSGFVSFLQKNAQQNFVDILPSFYNSKTDSVKRKLKYIGRKYKMKYQFNKLDFTDLIDRIIEIDRNNDLYIKYLKEPWFNQNQVPVQSISKDRWIEIFNG